MLFQYFNKIQRLKKCSTKRLSRIKYKGITFPGRLDPNTDDRGRADAAQRFIVNWWLTDK